MLLPTSKIEEFNKDLRELVNKHGLEVASNTPDFIIANYLVCCLKAFNTNVVTREEWYGRKTQEGETAEEGE